MSPDLQERLMDSIGWANRIFNVKLATTLTEALAEIDKLGNLLIQIRETQAPALKQFAEIVPYFRRLENPSLEMRAALADETPYQWRRKNDKSGYEVVRMDNADWREVISDEQTVVFESLVSDEARGYCEQIQFSHRYAAMLQIAFSQPMEQPQ